MANLFVDGFDNVSTATAPAKGWEFSGAVAITSAAARTGAQGLRSTATSVTATKGFAATDVVYVGFGVRIAAFDTLSRQILGLYDQSSAAQVSLWVTNAGQLQARRGTGNVLATSTESLASNSWSFVEVGVTVHDTAGVFVVKIDGQTVINLSGVDTKDSTITADVMSLRFQSVASGTNLDVDDLYVNDDAGPAPHNTFYGDHGVYAQSPNGNGASSALVGSDGNSVDNYLLVDETVTPDTADYVGSAVNDAQDTYAFTDLAGTMSVMLVQVSSYAAKTDVGARSFAPVVRSGGTDYTGTDRPIGTAYRYHQHTYTQNPATGAAWTQAGVNAAEFGFRVRP